MMKSVVLRGYHFSVYNRIAAVALHEKGVAYEREEIDPFSADMPKAYLARHPFRRVPALSHGAFDIYETAAITRYVDVAFDGPDLMPADAKAVARVAQVASIVDSYGYRPMVRQVFAHRVFRPAIGEEPDETEVVAGIQAALPVLGALNALVSESYVLDGQTISLADCHLAPMIAYFVRAPEGAALLRDYAALADWWAHMSPRESMIATDPGLPGD